MARMTREELLERLFHDDYAHLKGKRLRMTRVRVPGKEVCRARVIGSSRECVYHNLSLHIGVHEGEDHTGEASGLLLRFADHHRGSSAGADCCGGGRPRIRRGPWIQDL